MKYQMNENKNKIYLKISIIGDGGAGKTSILKAINNIFTPTDMTIGVDFSCLTSLHHSSIKSNIVIFDCGGQERFRFLQDSYIKGSKYFIFVYDRSRPSTLHSFSKWKEVIDKSGCPEANICIFGNKSDLALNDEEIEKLDVLDATSFVPTIKFIKFGSIHDKESINDLFKEIMKDILEDELQINIKKESISFTNQVKEKNKNNILCDFPI